MRIVIATVILMLGLAHFQTAKEENGGRFVLPNPKLLRCRSSDCFNLWLEDRHADAVFPKQLRIDMNQDCIYGLEAVYDKSVSMHDIELAIDEHYLGSKYTDFEKYSIRLWRVEPEKFAIQLSVADKKDEKRNVAEAGATHVIYIAFGGRSACNIP
ncbi:MAG: hypothetical protein WBP79_07525 [Candidatus Acidiferrales bacterium]